MAACVCGKHTIISWNICCSKSFRIAQHFAVLYADCIVVGEVRGLNHLLVSSNLNFQWSTEAIYNNYYRFLMWEFHCFCENWHFLFDSKCIAQQLLCESYWRSTTSTWTVNAVSCISNPETRHVFFSDSRDGIVLAFFFGDKTSIQTLFYKTCTQTFDVRPFSHKLCWW